MGLQPAYQEQLLAVVPKFTAAIGFPSSILLMREVWLSHFGGRGKRGGNGNTILRTLAFVAFFLSLDAFGWFLSTWAVPEGNFAFATGTIGTCEFQGFLLQVVIGAPLFTCAMSWYFWMIVACGKSAEDLLRYEKWVSPMIIAYSFGSGFFLLAKDQYNHIGAVCWIIGSPPGCANSVFHPNPDLLCERGNWAWLYGMVMFYGLLWTCIVLVIAFNLSIYWQLKDKREASWFATQSFLYCVAFVVTWAPSTTWSGMSWTAEGGSFAVDLLAGIFEPLGGFWNLIIFLRDRPASRRRIMRFLCCECCEERDDDGDEIDADGPPPAEAENAGADNNSNTTHTSTHDVEKAALVAEGRGGGGRKARSTDGRSLRGSHRSSQQQQQQQQQQASDRFGDEVDGSGSEFGSDKS